MAEDSDTVMIRMLRVSGRDKDTQWFEYRPAFNVPVVRISWELDTMDVELDTSVAEHLLRTGYAAPLPAGSATPPTPPAPPATPSAPAPPPWKAAPEKPDTETAETPPPAPSWLKNAGGDS